MKSRSPCTLKGVGCTNVGGMWPACPRSLGFGRSFHSLCLSRRQRENVRCQFQKWVSHRAILRHAVPVHGGRCFCHRLGLGAVRVKHLVLKARNVWGCDVLGIVSPQQQRGKYRLYPSILVFVSARIGWCLCSRTCAKGSKRLNNGGGVTRQKFRQNLDRFYDVFVQGGAERNDEFGGFMVGFMA